jgi:hypothetical protein
MDRLMRRARRFGALSGEEKGVLLLSLMLLPIVAVGLHRLGFARLRTWLEQRAPVPANALTADDVARARRLARMVNAAARRGPFRAYCLNRSLTLWWLLRRRGIASDVRIGVRKGANGFEAHAWVAIGDTVVNDTPRFVGTFTPLAADLIGAYRFVD